MATSLERMGLGAEIGMVLEPTPITLCSSLKKTRAGYIATNLERMSTYVHIRKARYTRP